LEDASEERVVPLIDALDFLPERALGDDEAIKAANGVAVPTPDTRDPTPVRLTHDDRLVAIAEPVADELKPMVVFK
jgi:hypothetical protein